MINGVKFFAMGADYIPEDCVYSRITRERMEYLVRSSVKAHYNCLRVWGGGYYPSDEFYDLCDEYGIIVWQDLMYACNVYDVTQPSILSCIGEKSIRRATVIKDYAYTITTRQDRTPAQVIDCGKGRYRYLTELECWRLQGYTDEDFERAKKAQQKKGRYYTALYKQAGNSIAVPIFESIFRKIILNEVREKEEQK